MKFNRHCVAVPGVGQVDQVLHILLTTNMFVGGFLGFFLDNTIPGGLKTDGLCVLYGAQYTSPTVLLTVAIGAKRERGLPDREHGDVPDQFLASLELYDLPFGLTSFFSSRSWVRYIPFCPWRARKTEANNVTQEHELLSHGEFD